MKNYKTFSTQYILIEDSKGKHQPFYKEYLKTPPTMAVIEQIGCPFLPNKKRREGKSKATTTNKKRKTYYCEVCCMRYESYSRHISQDHMACECPALDEFVKNFKCEPIDKKDAVYENSPSDGMRSVYNLSFCDESCM